MTITQGGTAADIGLTLDSDGWYACMEVVSDRLAAALQAAFPAGSWASAWDASGRLLRITSSVSFNASLHAGFAAWWNTGTTHSSVTTVVSLAAMPDVYADQWIGMSLPVRLWHRSVVGDREAVVWSSHWGWDLLWTRRESETWAIPQMRTPFVVYLGDSDDWALGDRDGYIVCRLTDASMRRAMLNSQAMDHGVWPMRVAWLNPTIGA